MAGWIAQGLSIAIDVAGIGSGIPGARFGFAPALSITLWLVLAVYELESRVVPLTGARRALATIGVVVVVVAWFFPGQVHPQTASVWAPLHWLLGIASYGLFGVAVLHALLLNRAERQMRQTPTLADPARRGGLPLLRLERLTFRFVGAGFVVLTAAIVLGVWFSDRWRWDHKAVFSILGWLVFAGPARRPPRLRLAWPARDARRVRRRGAAAAGLRRLALRARGRPASATGRLTRHEIHPLPGRGLRPALAAARRARSTRRRRRPAAGAAARPGRSSPAPTAACTCRATKRCPAAAACSAATPTAPPSRKSGPLRHERRAAIGRIGRRRRQEVAPAGRRRRVVVRRLRNDRRHGRAERRLALRDLVAERCRRCLASAGRAAAAASPRRRSSASTARSSRRAPRSASRSS